MVGGAQATIERVYNRNNASDMEAQWYYRMLRDTYAWHVVAQFAVLYLIGGFPAMVSSAQRASPTASCFHSLLWCGFCSF